MDFSLFDDCSLQNRGASHRIAAYKIFQSFGYYTLTMDYRSRPTDYKLSESKNGVMTTLLCRGYGDSIMSFPLNETTVVEVEIQDQLNIT